MFRHPAPTLYNQSMQGIRTLIVPALLLLVARPAAAQQEEILA
ncbi:MAG: hypothetical protein QF363_14280 [Planctomycetaceae bacterium]|nr:hypothetical protein [Planctomycetaceae bacterium]